MEREKVKELVQKALDLKDRETKIKEELSAIKKELLELTEYNGEDFKEELDDLILSIKPTRKYGLNQDGYEKLKEALPIETFAKLIKEEPSVIGRGYTSLIKSKKLPQEHLDIIKDSVKVVSSASKIEYKRSVPKKAED